MKQKGGNIDALISAAGTAAVPFVFYKANKMFARNKKSSRRTVRQKYSTKNIKTPKRTRSSRRRNIKKRNTRKR